MRRGLFRAVHPLCLHIEFQVYQEYWKYYVYWGVLRVLFTLKTKLLKGLSSCRNPTTFLNFHLSYLILHT